MAGRHDCWVLTIHEASLKGILDGFGLLSTFRYETDGQLKVSADGARFCSRRLDESDVPDRREFYGVLVQQG